MTLPVFLAGAGALFGVAAFNGRRRIKELASAVDNAPPYMVDPVYTVGVAIPSYNEADYLPLLLASLRNQTHAVTEIFVADASDDRVDEIESAAFEFGAILVSARKGNISRSRNQAASHVTSDVLIVTDADSILSHTYIEEMVRYLDEYDLVQGSVVEYGLDTSLVALSQVSNETRDIYAPAAGLVMFKETFDSVGGYNENVNPIEREGEREDIDFQLRVEEAGGEVVRFPDGPVVGVSARRNEARGVSFTTDMDKAFREGGELTR